MAKQLVKKGLPACTDKCIERWWEDCDMQDTRTRAKGLNERRYHEIIHKDMAEVTAITQDPYRKYVKHTTKP